MNVQQRAQIVHSAQGDYRVDSLDSVADVVTALERVKNPFIIVDEKVVQFWPAIAALLELVPNHRVRAEESEKTLGGVERALLALQGAAATREATVIAVGGGIIQDIATLTAHLWYRGVGLILVPTTLLAMADSCIGAKSAINLGAYKNQIGTFQSPRGVLVTEDFTRTLSDGDILSGYGEIVKLAAIESADAFTQLCDDIRRDGIRGPKMPEHIRGAVETKRRFIELDEYDVGPRRILNYGHTFGHALESILNYSIPHGTAVAWGMDVANYVATRLGYLNQTTYKEMHSALTDIFSWRVDDQLRADELFAAMKRDKKVVGTKVNLILPNTLGDFAVRPTPFDDALMGILTSYLEAENIFGKPG